MDFVWCDYDPSTMAYIESWLDPDAVRFTGLEDGFRDFYEYWASQDGFVIGKNYWCKVVFQNSQPIAIIALSLYGQKIIMMELLVEPRKRGQGIATKLLAQLLENKEILGFSIQESEAVIFPNNTASQKAFQNACFHYHHTHEDGTSMLFVYNRKNDP